MAVSYPPRVGTVFAERYQLRELLGSGGVGQVFRAWDVQAQKAVALKVFNPARVSPSTWEAYARVVAGAVPVRHPDLVLPQPLPPTLPATPIAVMESLAGEDLATLRARLGKVPWARALEIGARCADVLHAVYTKTGVAHRDLKAGNVFIAESGGVKLLDYGVAEFDVQSADRTRVDTALGMVDYKAPEQLETSVGGQHSDMFSLAILVYEMIAGERPFTGPSYFEVARKILLEPPPRLTEVLPDARIPVGVDVFLHRAFEKRPDDRYADLAAMQRAFVEVLRNAPRSTVIGTTREAVMKAAAKEVDDSTVLQVASRTGRKPAASLHDVPPASARPVSSSRQVKAGERAVVVGSGEEGLAGATMTDRTVVGAAPTGGWNVAGPPAADRTVVLADPGAHSSDDDDPRTMIDPRSVAARGQQRAESTMILGDEGGPQLPRAESTMILGDDGGPPRAESTMILADDGAPRAEGTLMIPDDGGSKAGGTMQIPESGRIEGTMQMPGEKPSAWTLHKTLIIVNVTCGVLILLGLLVLVLGGGETTGK